VERSQKAKARFAAITATPKTCLVWFGFPLCILPHLSLSSISNTIKGTDSYLALSLPSPFFKIFTTPTEPTTTRLLFARSLSVAPTVASSLLVINLFLYLYVESFLPLPSFCKGLQTAYSYQALSLSLSL